MQSVGEFMAIGRTFRESIQKAFRALEVGIDGLEPKWAYEKDPEFDYGWADWWESTRDLLIVNDKIYVSFVNFNIVLIKDKDNDTKRTNN